MKRFFYLLAVTAMFAACSSPEGQEVDSSAAVDVDAEDMKTTTMAAAQYNVDPAVSVVNWEGAKPTGTHTGTIPVTNGQLMVAGDKIVGGKFVLDIRQLTNTDMPAAEGGDKLVGHLKSADFFDVEKYPMADFTITQVQPITDSEDGRTHDITGNLTMKGETRSITVPATVSMDGGMLKAATPKFTIDRKEWGMNYGSSSIVGLAKDKMINDEVGLEIMLVANK